MKPQRRNKQVRVQDIAKELNISASSVSRALNDHPRISRETKEKVKEVASRLGYFTDTPKLMNPVKTKAIAVLVPTLENSIYRAIVSGINRCMSENNFQMFVVDTQNDISEIKSFLHSFNTYALSGIIHLVSDKTMSPDLFRKARAESIPLVRVFEPDENQGFSSVVPDLFQGIDKIVEYLIPQNIAKAALILEDDKKPEDIQIASGFESAWEESDCIKPSIQTHYLSPLGMNFEELAISVLAKKPDVIIVKDSSRTVEFRHLAEKNGLSIPNDIILIAIDSDIPKSILSTNLSLLKIPAFEMGFEASTMLMDQIQNATPEWETKVLPVGFILKGSAIRLK